MESLSSPKDKLSDGGPSDGKLLSEQDLIEIEKAHPHGLSSAQIIKIFQARGVRFSEATFRKYVQQGLLPRSRRIGVKGKHQGSRGVYPCATVRRLNSIKKLMSQSFTIEEIQISLNAFKRHIDALESALNELFKGFEREIIGPNFDVSRRRELIRDVTSARESANSLMRTIIGIENQLSTPDKSQRKIGNGFFDF